MTEAENTAEIKRLERHWCGYALEDGYCLRCGEQVHPKVEKQAGDCVKAAPDQKKEGIRMAEEFEERTGGKFWKPENEGDSIEGTLVKVRQGQYGDVYDMETAAGTQTVPSSAVLANRVTAGDEGKYVRIVFDGLLQSKIKGRNPTRLFKVFFRK